MISFSYQKTCGIPVATLVEIFKEKKGETVRLFLEKEMKSNFHYDSPYGSLQVPSDRIMQQGILELVKEKKALQPAALFVVGIGGSTLGTKAVLQALHGRIPFPGRYTIPLYFAETVDTDRMHTLVAIMEQMLVGGKQILISVISKSGTTLETVANFHVLLSVLQKHRPETYKKYVVVITDKGSSLFQAAQQEGFSILEIPGVVGGRFSVFTAVGLFPLAVAGIDIKQLCAGAAFIIKKCVSPDLEDNPAIMSALIHYYYHTQGVRISDMFLFSVDLEAVGKWYRQLIAESIGKEYDKTGRQVCVGITPTVSLGSIDLHSVAQLYLGGPRDKFTTFVTVEKSDVTITVPALVSVAGNKTFTEIMHALSEGTQIAYLKNNRPFCSFVLPEKSAYYLGQFLQCKMIETLYLGYLLDINPFDQPNVDLYKREAYALLR